MYEHGEGVPQDYKQAVDWYIKAANQGEESAQRNLIDMYFSDDIEDYKQAYIRLLQASRFFRLATSTVQLM